MKRSKRKRSTVKARTYITKEKRYYEANKKHSKGDSEVIIKNVAGVETGFVIRPTTNPKHLIVDVVPLTKGGKIGDPSKHIKIELDIRKKDNGIIKVDGHKIADLNAVIAPNVTPDSKVSTVSAILQGGKVLFKHGLHFAVGSVLSVVWLINAITVCLSILMNTLKVAGVGLVIYTLWDWGLLSHPVALGKLGLKAAQHVINVNPFVTFLSDVSSGGGELAQVAKDILLKTT